jgi:alpha-D-xyloside xylohydrolase
MRTMKQFLINSILVLSSTLAIQAAPTGLDQVGQMRPLVKAAADGFSFVRLENGVQLRANGVTKNILFYGPTTVRVNENIE